MVMFELKMGFVIILSHLLMFLLCVQYTIYTTYTVGYMNEVNVYEFFSAMGWSV